MAEFIRHCLTGDVIHLMYFEIPGNLSWLLCNIVTMGWECKVGKEKGVLYDDKCSNRRKSFQLIRS